MRVCLFSLSSFCMFAFSINSVITCTAFVVWNKTTIEHIEKETSQNPSVITGWPKVGGQGFSHNLDLHPSERNLPPALWATAGHVSGGLPSLRPIKRSWPALSTLLYRDLSPYSVPGTPGQVLAPPKTPGNWRCKQAAYVEEDPWDRQGP